MLRTPFNLIIRHKLYAPSRTGRGRGAPRHRHRTLRPRSRPRTDQKGNPMYPECRHVRPSGGPCHSPALAKSHFCYYHARLISVSRHATPIARRTAASPRSPHRKTSRPSIADLIQSELQQRRLILSEPEREAKRRIEGSTFRPSRTPSPSSSHSSRYCRPSPPTSSTP